MKFTPREIDALVLWLDEVFYGEPEAALVDDDWDDDEIDEVIESIKGKIERRRERERQHRAERCRCPRCR